MDLCPSLADRFHSSGPQVDFTGHLRFKGGPFSPPAVLFLLLAWHTWTVFYQTCGPLPAACGPFRSREPFICYVLTSVPRSRTVFIHQNPERTLLVTRGSRADRFLRERTFFYCLRDTRDQYSIKRTDLCPPRADLLRSRGPSICHVWTSVPRSRTVFIHRDSEWTSLVTRASRADHSLREWTFF